MNFEDDIVVMEEWRKELNLRPWAEFRDLVRQDWQAEIRAGARNTNTELRSGRTTYGYLRALAIAYLWRKPLYISAWMSRHPICYDKKIQELTKTVEVWIQPFRYSYGPWPCVDYRDHHEVPHVNFSFLRNHNLGGTYLEVELDPRLFNQP